MLSRAFLVAQVVNIQKTLVQFLGWEIPWKGDKLCNPVFLGIPGGSDSKGAECNVGDLGLIPESGRSPGGGHGNPL